MTSQLQGVSARGPEVLLLQEIQSALEFNFQLRTFRQLQFMATSGFHQVSSQGRLSRAFGSFFRILVLDAAQCAHSGALACGLPAACCVLFFPSISPSLSGPPDRTL